MAHLNGPDAEFLQDARIGHLASVNSAGQPHVIPVCFAFDGRTVYSVLDRKPKSAPVVRLRRVKNILANPKVSLVVDHYEEDWARLRYVLLLGAAELLTEGDEWAASLELLREKYPQYQEMDLADSPVIKITPERLVGWSFTPEG